PSRSWCRAPICPASSPASPPSPPMPRASPWSRPDRGRPTRSCPTSSGRPWRGCRRRPATPWTGGRADGMTRLARAEVESLMQGRPESTLESALEVFEVFASGSLTDEVYILDDVAGKRIAIAPTTLKDKYRRGGSMAIIVVLHQMGAGGPVDCMSVAPLDGYCHVKPVTV